jgi:hypothetical protein
MHNRDACVGGQAQGKTRRNSGKWKSNGGWWCYLTSEKKHRQGYKRLFSGLFALDRLVFIREMRFHAGRTYRMTELCLGMAGNIFLDFVPISLVIPDRKIGRPCRATEGLKDRKAGARKFPCAGFRIGRKVDR